MPAHRIAGLDLGSNTLKITVADVDEAGALRVVGERAIITRMGQDLDKTKRVSPEAMERTKRGLGELMAFAKAERAERFACVATAGLRGAANGRELIDWAKSEHQLTIEIIDGMREAELAF